MAQGTPRRLRQARRDPAALEPGRDQPDAAPGGPSLGGAREIAEPGAEVRQGERGAGGHRRQRPGEAVAHRRGAAEPAVGAGDVPQRLGHGGRVRGRVVEQLGPDGAERERRRGTHESAV